MYVSFNDEKYNNRIVSTYVKRSDNNKEGDVNLSAKLVVVVGTIWKGTTVAPAIDSKQAGHIRLSPIDFFHPAQVLLSKTVQVNICFD